MKTTVILSIIGTLTMGSVSVEAAHEHRAAVRRGAVHLRGGAAAWLSKYCIEECQPPLYTLYRLSNALIYTI